jgi:hypothetical protein
MNDEEPGLSNTDYLICGIVIGVLIAAALFRWLA